MHTFDETGATSSVDANGCVTISSFDVTFSTSFDDDAVFTTVDTQLSTQLSMRLASDTGVESSAGDATSHRGGKDDATLPANGNLFRCVSSAMTSRGETVSVDGPAATDTNGA